MTRSTPELCNTLQLPDSWIFWDVPNMPTNKWNRMLAEAGITHYETLLTIREKGK